MNRKFAIQLLIAAALMTLLLGRQLPEDDFQSQLPTAEAASTSTTTHQVDPIAASLAISRAIAHPAASQILTSSPAAEKGPPSNLSAVYFINHNVGFGVTGEYSNGSASLIKTTDGGTRWSAIGTWSGEFDNLSWSGHTAVATLTVARPNQPGATVELVITTDNGKSWHLVHPTIEVASAPNGWEPELYAYVTASHTMWLLVSPEAATTGEQSPVWVSHDVGQSFKHVNLPVGSVSTGGFSANESGASIALSVQNATTHTYDILVGNDVDGWKRIGPNTSTPIYAVDYASQSQVFAGGGNFAKFSISPAEEVWCLNPNRPNDVRVVWRREAPKGMAYKPIVQLQMLADGTGYMLTGGVTMGGNLPAPGSLFLTRDSGRSVSETHAWGTSCDVAGTSVRIVGNGQGIEYSADSGATWHTQFRPSTVYVQRIQFLDAEHGYATTQFGVYGTSDGGRRWRMLPIRLTDTATTRLDFVSPSTVYRWGVAHLEVSTDGGQTWQLIHLPPLAQIDSIQVRPGGVINVAGLPVPNGSVTDEPFADEFLTTHDSGTHWDVFTDPFHTGPVHVEFVSSSLGYGRAPQLSLKTAYHHQGLFVTTNGGRQWTNVNLSSLRDTGSNTLAAYPGGVALDGELNTSTTNGTGQFQPVGTLVQADASLTQVSAYRLNQWVADDLTFTSHNDGWLASNGRLFHTTDGGKHFNEVWVVQ